uniref:Secreted protein n=1 Tax=Anopheles coluzzii TaxID=1518534 RepID=A0A8W7P843_ANOCL
LAWSSCLCTCVFLELGSAVEENERGPSLLSPTKYCVATWCTSQPVQHAAGATALAVLVHLHQQRIVHVLVVPVRLLQLEMPRPDRLVVALQQLVVEAPGDTLVQKQAQRLTAARGRDQRDAFVRQQLPDRVDQLRSGLVEEQAVGGQDEVVPLVRRFPVRPGRLFPLQHGRFDRAVELVQHERVAHILHRQLVPVGHVHEGGLAVLRQHQPGQTGHTTAQLQHRRSLELGQPGKDVVGERFLRRPHADVTGVVEPDQLARRPGPLGPNQPDLQPVPIVQPVHVHVLVLLVPGPIRLDQVKLGELIVLARIVPERLRQAASSVAGRSPCCGRFRSSASFQLARHIGPECCLLLFWPYRPGRRVDLFLFTARLDWLGE